MQLMCFDSKMVAVPHLLIFPQLVASLTATAMGKKETEKHFFSQNHKNCCDKIKTSKYYIAVLLHSIIFIRN
jgi:hypothetical protein